MNRWHYDVREKQATFEEVLAILMKDRDMPLNPTQQQCEQSLALLWQAMGEFSYSSDADRANALGLLLTAVLRPALKGPVPLALIEAPKQGTGKSLLRDVVSMIATGGSAAILPLSGSPEEFQREITPLLLAETPIIAIDGITGRFQSEHLAAVLTAERWYVSLPSPSQSMSAPHRALWVATGTTITLRGDLIRRCYRIRLDAGVFEPFLRTTFTHSDLLGWVREHRTELVDAVLTLACAWYTAGKPQADHLLALERFSEWVEVVSGILKCAGVSGFLSNLEKRGEGALSHETSSETVLKGKNDARRREGPCEL